VAEQGWMSQEFETFYTLSDERLVGYGYPPYDPEYQMEHPGQDRILLRSCRVKVSKAGAVTEDI